MPSYLAHFGESQADALVVAGVAEGLIILNQKDLHPHCRWRSAGKLHSCWSAVGAAHLAVLVGRRVLAGAV